jgi:HlyD family secretion protein
MAPPEGKVVWKLVDGAPRPVPIKTGLTDGTYTQVLEGQLTPGDVLITDIKVSRAGAPRRIGGF